MARRRGQGTATSLGTTGGGDGGGRPRRGRCGSGSAGAPSRPGLDRPRPRALAPDFLGRSRRPPCTRTCSAPSASRLPLTCPPSCPSSPVPSAHPPRTPARLPPFRLPPVTPRPCLTSPEIGLPTGPVSLRPRASQNFPMTPRDPVTPPLCPLLSSTSSLSRFVGPGPPSASPLFDPPPSAWSVTYSSLVLPDLRDPVKSPL